MSNFSGILDLLDEENRDELHISASEAGGIKTQELKQSNIDIKYNSDLLNPFSIELFVNEIKLKSENENKLRQYYSNNINGYVGEECIGSTILKIINYPMKSFAHKWLPIVMRAVIGNAIHDFIQKNTNQFSEQERSIKVPSLKCSVRVDGLISNNILVEIKSCTYQDYKTIINKSKPRPADFYQVVMYKYLIENYLQEAKQQKEIKTPAPFLDNYKIDTFQFIYVAHDILSADVESFNDCIEITKKVKQLLNSKNNKFFFITTVLMDLTKINMDPYINYIKNKIERINWYVDNNKIPTIEDEFVNTKKCFFCLFDNNCPIKK